MGKDKIPIQQFPQFIKLFHLITNRALARYCCTIFQINSTHKICCIDTSGDECVRAHREVMRGRESVWGSLRPVIFPWQSGHPKDTHQHTHTHPHRERKKREREHGGKKQKKCEEMGKRQKGKWGQIARGRTSMSSCLRLHVADVVQIDQPWLLAGSREFTAVVQE